MLLLVFALAPRAFAQQIDDHNPVGVTGAFGGNIETGGSYGALDHSAHRGPIDDIIVPGSLGKYPLKMTRYYNSRSWYANAGLSAGWAHGYAWLLTTAGSKVASPQGSVYDFHCGHPLGVSEGWDDGIQGPHPNGGTWRLADGGKVHFNNVGATEWIEDPYGIRTTIEWANGQLRKVTEGGGRYLLFTFGTGPGYTDPETGAKMLEWVQAYDGRGNQIDSVHYTYTDVDSGGTVNGQSIIKKMLTEVTYSDGTSASYTYRTDNVPQQIQLGSWKAIPLLESCNDVRYKGPMRQIAYQYQSGGPHGEITKELSSLGGALVSSISPGVPPPTASDARFPEQFTETRGDGPSRTFTYTPLHIGRNFEPQGCPNIIGDTPPSQFLLTYTDFQGHTTQLGYDANWYVNSVRDANNHTTSYTRGAPIGQITRITHPDTTHIDYTYYNEGTGHLGGHYIYTVSDERGNITYHTRDAYNRITRTDHKDASNNILAYETFTYNGFGQVLTHRLKNGAYESFAYDSRGLLTDKWNPKQNAIPSGTDPHTHYTYYTSGPWTDRILTMTLPANVSGYMASETYEYDRNSSGAAVAGRGLETKITHADGNYQSFGYDAYGNKIWEQNELRQQTTYTYDAYNRVLTVKNPLNQTTTYTYAPTNGTGTSPYLHTTNNPDTVTTPTGIITTNDYDQNFRKTSTTVASSTTRFGYDVVGNPTTVTDPLNHTTTTTYDSRNRKRTVTNALNQTTTFTYDAANNVTGIDHPDTTWETKTYDAMNRMLTDTVPQTSTINLTTWFVYNPSGTIYKIVDPNGQPTWFTYNASDEKIGMIYSGQTQSQSWTYDAGHNLASRTTVGGKMQTFGYDNRNRKITMRWSNNADWANFGYDAASRLTSATSPNSTVTHAYDAAGQLTLDRQNITGLGIKDVNYIYDADGKQTRLYVTGAGYDYTFAYDGMGRFSTISATGNANPYFQYYYDAASNETQRYNLYSGVNQIYTRDALNRMARRDVKKGTTTLSYEVYGYDAMSRLRTVTREDNKQDQFIYYWDGELSTAQYGATPAPTPTPTPAPSPTPTPTPTPPPGQVATPTFRPDGAYYSACAYSYTFNVIISTTTSGAQISYTTDGSTPTPTHGTVISNGGTASVFVQTGQTKTLKAIGFKTGMTNSNIKSADYSFDRECGQAPETIRTVGYYLDEAGNRTSVTDTVNGNATYTPNALNQYTAVTGSTISNGPEHEISVYNNVVYTYINDERLSSASDASHTYNLYYDALDRCVKRTLNGVVTYYVYDGEKPILEYNSAGGLAGWNLYGKGIDEIIERGAYGSDNAWHWYFFQQDRNGNVTHLTNYGTTVTAIERYRYDAFGMPTIYNGSGQVITATAFGNRFLFTGREYANLFGFYEYRARAYHPALGRFMSEDPKLADAGDYNLFRYCHNDPIDFTDSMGTVTDARREDPWYTHTQQAEMLDKIAATRELLGLSSTYMRAALSAQEGLAIAYTNQSQSMYTYSLKPQYNVGDLSGARGYQYVWDSNDKCSGQCLTGVQHLTGTPDSSTPLVRGAAVGADTLRGIAIAKGWVVRNGQYIYPSKPASQSDNHAAVFVAPTGKGYAQILSQYNISPSNRAPLHLEVVSASGWHVITSPLPARTASGSELRAWDGSIPW